MAASLLQSYDIQLDKFNVLSCNMCYKTGNEVEHFNYCIECKKYFCSKCLGKHTELKPKANTLSHPNDVIESTKTDRQAIHQNCLSSRTSSLAKHNNSTLEQRLSWDKEVNKLHGDHKGKEHKQSTVPESPIHLQLDISKKMQAKQKELQSFHSQKIESITKIKDFCTTVRDLADKFEIKALTNIEKLHKQFKTCVDEELDQLKAMLKAAQDRIKQYYCTNNGHHLDTNETLRVTLSRAERSRSKTTNDLQKEIDLDLQTRIEEFIYSINKLDDCRTESTSSRKLIGEHNVKVKGESSTCDINGVCCLGEGTLLITDWNNAKLKRLDKDYRVVDTCFLPGIPWTVCQVTRSEVAVTLFLVRRVQFVSIDNDMVPTRSFSIGEVCRGIAYLNSQLFVACGGGGIGEGQGHMRVYDLDGILQRSIMTDSTGDPIMACPLHIAVNDITDTVLIADREKGVVCVDVNGHKLWVFSDLDIQEVKSICKGDNGEIYICDSKSEQIISLGQTGKGSKVILNAQDGIRHPQSIQYDPDNSRLIVTQGNMNHIMIFNQK